MPPQDEIETAMNPHGTTPASGSAGKLPWVRPQLTPLPRLTDLTLQTGAGIDGFGGPSSTVFGG
jgi:hypothetical protein